jgi:hypothetical protein
VLVSSIGSAVFGTCWLVFVVPSIARRRTAPSDDPFPHDELSRSPGWLMVAVIFSAVHLWFGRGFQTPG